MRADSRSGSRLNSAASRAVSFSMYRIAGVLALVVALAACGGADWNAAQRAAAKAPKSSGTPHTLAAAATEKAYVDAMMQSATLNGGTKTPADAKNTRCIATAIVHGYGAAAFAAANIDPADLRPRDSTLDALPDPDDDQYTAIGSALQRCGHIADLVAIGIGQGIKVYDGATISCLARHVGTDPDARRFLVVSALDRPVTLGAAHGVVGVMAACIDFADLILKQANVQVDPTTRACLLDTLHASSAALEDYMAAALSKGTVQPPTDDFTATIGVTINRCRPSARTGFTVPSA